MAGKRQESIAIRLMRPLDITAGMRLKALAGWNQVEADWRVFLNSRPEGCFVAVHEDAVIGTVTTAGYGERVAWISMLLVDPAHRGRGIGTRLMRAAIASLAGYPTIVLDATPAGQALYERLGFRGQGRLLRLATEGLPSLETPSPGKWVLRCLQTDDALNRVATLDYAVFGADRTLLLQALARRAPEAAWAALCDERIGGFCLGRGGARFQQFGPVVAETHEQATALCRVGLNAWSGKAVVVDVPASEKGFIEWLRGVGFAVQRPLTRMALGEPLARPQTLARQFAICGPEYG